MMEKKRERDGEYENEREREKERGRKSLFFKRQDKFQIDRQIDIQTNG